MAPLPPILFSTDFFYTLLIDNVFSQPAIMVCEPRRAEMAPLFFQGGESGLLYRAHTPPSGQQHSVCTAVIYFCIYNENIQLLRSIVFFFRYLWSRYLPTYCVTRSVFYNNYVNYRYLSVDHRLTITSIDVRTEMDDKESVVNWTRCVAY